MLIESQTMIRRSWLAFAILLMLTLSCLLAAVPLTARAETSSLFGSTHPAITADPDTHPVELGVRFSSDVDGTVTGIRFYKSLQNSGVHVGTLWTSAGQKLASTSLSRETRYGWQTALFDRPVHITAGHTYVASYLAPRGRYASSEDGFDSAFRSGHLRVPVGGGVYSYEPGRFPFEVWHNSNYYVDVLFNSAKASTPATTATTTSTPPLETSNVLHLPRIPWEGGPSYYQKFSGSTAMTNPNKFPIGVWWDDFSNDSEVKWDKAQGINFYTQLNGSEDGQLLVKNDMYVIQGSDAGQLVRNLSFNDPHWLGWWLSDERDASHTQLALGLPEVKGQIEAQKAYCASGVGCKFSYANYTAIVTSYYNDPQVSADEAFVNLFQGPVSVDRYYYTEPTCFDPDRFDYTVNPPDYAHCRTSAAYGNLIRNLRVRDASDGNLKPLWGFVENGAPDTDGHYITAEQMNGAAWNMIINEARGLVWFNQSFSGACQAGNVVRSAQIDPHGCNAARVASMKQTNAEIQHYAPVLNTQSFQWNFGTGLNTMLKVSGDSAYVFSMIGLNSDPGRRTFRLPAAITGTTVTVEGENRTIPVLNGTFTDTFSKEYSKHIYKITI